MRSTNDRTHSGRGMTNVINKLDEPYRDRERAYKILRISSTSKIRNVTCLTWPMFCRHVNELLRHLSPRNRVGDLRRNRIRATRKVLKAIHTITGIRFPQWADMIEQDQEPIVLYRGDHRPLARPMIDPMPTKLYHHTRPLPYRAHVRHLLQLENDTLLDELQEHGIAQRTTRVNRDAAATADGEHWKYQATHRFVAQVRDGEVSNGDGWTFEDVEMSAVATPHDATSLWAALS